MSKLDALYANLPVWAQTAAVTSYGVYWHWLRCGPGFQRYVAEFRRREKFTADEWKLWQAKKLKQLLANSVQHVPYYHETWSVSEKQAAMSGALDDLPVLKKQSLRSNESAFVRQDRNLRLRFTHLTSGSTGTPIASTRTADEIRQTTALREVRSAGWAGVSYRLPRATFSGRLVEPRPESEGPYYRYNCVERQAYLSAFHLKPAAAIQYVDALRRCRIRWLTGYSVSYFLLAQFMLEQGLAAPTELKAVITTSEKLTQRMREVMESAFGCPIFEEYGTVENVAFASECEHGRLHVSPDLGVVEILRPDGSACSPHEPGRVVATGIIRELQPLIRYELGDVASWDDAPCPCGRALPVLQEILGRVEDVVTGPDGRQMVRFHGLFLGLPVREGQVIQETIDRIRVKVVASPGLEQKTEQVIKARVHQRLGNEVEVAVEQVETIPRSAGGKFIPVISLIPKTERAEPKRTGIK